VEHHPLDRDAGLEGLQQVPGDRLALAVAVGGQVQLVDVFEQALEFGDDGLLVRADHVERFEVVVHVDSGAGPLHRLELGGHVGGPLRKVAGVPAALPLPTPNWGAWLPRIGPLNESSICIWPGANSGVKF